MISFKRSLSFLLIVDLELSTKLADASNLIFCKDSYFSSDAFIITWNISPAAELNGLFVQQLGEKLD